MEVCVTVSRSLGLILDHVGIEPLAVDVIPALGGECRTILVPTMVVGFTSAPKQGWNRFTGLGSIQPTPVSFDRPLTRGNPDVIHSKSVANEVELSLRCEGQQVSKIILPVVEIGRLGVRYTAAEGATAAAMFVVMSVGGVKEGRSDHYGDTELHDYVVMNAQASVNDEHVIPIPAG